MDVENVRVVFDTFDLDKSGGISLDELQSAIKVLGIPNCSKQRVAEMFHEADIDRSGEIDFDEVRNNRTLALALRRLLTPPPPLLCVHSSARSPPTRTVASSRA